MKVAVVDCCWIFVDDLCPENISDMAIFSNRYFHPIFITHRPVTDMPMILPARGRERFIRQRSRRSHNRMLLVDELTRELEPYVVELPGGNKTLFRKGRRWYSKDGQHVADSSEITSIQIPARRVE